jgi:hypothetical protein
VALEYLTGQAQEGVEQGCTVAGSAVFLAVDLEYAAQKSQAGRFWWRHV